MNSLRIQILILMLFSSVAVLGGEEWISRIRKEHPRMFFNSDTWGQIKQRSDGSAKAYFAELLKEVESYPADPKCSGMGPVVFREIKTATGSYKTTKATPINTVKEWGSQAAKCALAWRLTRDSRYLEKAKKMLTVSIAAYHEAYRNGREVCWYSTSRIMALCAYDWIWEALSPDERKSIIVPLVAHVEEAHPKRGRKDVIRRNASIYNTGYYGVRAMQWYSGLAAYGDGFCDELALLHLKEGYKEFKQLLEFRAGSAGDDGGLVSAVPVYCMGMYPYTHFNFLHTWMSAFNENIAENYPALSLFPNWIYWTWIKSPDAPRSSGFGDDEHSQNLLPMEKLFGHMIHYMHFFRNANPSASRLAASLCRYAPNRDVGGDIFPLYPFILDANGYGIVPYSEEELEANALHTRHFDTLGQFIMRSGWKEDSTYCTFTAGAKYIQHKHYDENNFIIYKNDFLALDSGSRGIETDHCLKYYYSQTVAHNCMLIHAPGEPLPYYWGPEYNGVEGKSNHGGQVEKKTAEVLAFETDKDFTYIASDAAKSYGKKCGECLRQFVYILPDMFVVYDRVSVTNASYRKEWLLHTKNEPKIEGSLMQADCGKGRLFCQTIFPEKAVIQKVGGKGKEFWAHGKNWELDSRFSSEAESLAKKYGRGPYYGAWRIEVKPNTANKKDSFLHVLTAADKSISVPPKSEKIAEGEFDGVAITAKGFQREGTRGTLFGKVLFRKDGKAGGRITLIFDPEGSLPEKVVVDRMFSDTVQSQKGLIPLAE